MKPHYLILIMFGILIACNNSQKIKDNSGDTKSTGETREKMDKDSVRIIGTKIIKGERIWGNNEKYLFSIMDSLTNKSPESRSFYFKAFGKICEQADGYVAEAIGLYVLKSFEFDPREFILNSKFLSDSAFKSMGYNGGLEISLSESDPDNAFNALVEKTGEKTKDLDGEDKIKLEIFFSKMKEGLDSNKEN